MHLPRFGDPSGIRTPDPLLKRQFPNFFSTFLSVFIKFCHITGIYPNLSGFKKELSEISLQHICNKSLLLFVMLWLLFLEFYRFLYVDTSTLIVLCSLCKEKEKGSST